MKELTQERLKELLHYNPETGEFTRKVRTARRVKVGDVAGTINGRGYIQIMINNKKYLAHRLAFLYMDGSFPEDGMDTDHINQIKTDNSWNNLRIVSHQDNSKNRSLQSNNKVGHVGVSWHNASNKWRAQITADGKNIHLGYFDNLDDAVAVRKAAEIKYGYHTNHGQQTKAEEDNEAEK